MKIENQLEKEFTIFSKHGDMCSLAEYIAEFKATYPHDISSLYETFVKSCEQCKSVEKSVKKYLRESYVKGRLRYRISMGINRPSKKAK